MNAAIRAVTRAAISQGIRVKAIYRGYKGLIDGEVKEDSMGEYGINGTAIEGGYWTSFYGPKGIKKERGRGKKRTGKCRKVNCFM